MTTQARALHVRRRWADAGGRAEARRRVLQRGAPDPTAEAWLAILDGRHPLVAWLESDLPVSALPEVWPDGLPTRALLSSHPFPQAAAWSTQAM